MFGIEHLLIIMVILLKIYMSADPAWLKTFKKRKLHNKFVKRVNVAAKQRQAYILKLLKQRIASRFTKRQRPVTSPAMLKIQS